MIVSFKDKATEALSAGRAVKAVPGDIVKRANRAMTMLNSAASLHDLTTPPGNRLEALKGDRKGQHSIRINDQWRICFVWTEAGPADVEIVTITKVGDWPEGCISP